MTKDNGLMQAIAASAIVAVVLNVVAFAAPFPHNQTFWVCYAFIWVAILATVASSYYLYRTGRSLTSALYRVSIPAIAVGYLCVAALLSLAMMALGFVPAWVAVVLHVVLLGACLLGMLGGHAGAQLVEDGDIASSGQTSFMNALRTQSQMALAVPCGDEAKKRLSSLAESIRFSDPVGSVATSQMDEQLLSMMTQVNLLLGNGEEAQALELCDKVQMLLDQRNLVCRNAK